MFGHFILLLMAGLATGMVNAVAGGASVFLYPLLISLGLSPIVANATTSVAVWPGAVSSAVGYRQFLKTLPKRYFALLVPCLFGGFIGAVLLGRTSNRTFEFIVPWFILAAVILLAFQDKVHSWLNSREGRSLEAHHPTIMLILITLAVLLLAVYGGYFGGGFGIMMLAFLGLTSLSNIHQMNGLKNLTAISMNTVAIGYFIVSGLIGWSAVLPLFIGNSIGGWLGATHSTRLPQKTIRASVIIIGLLVAAILFARTYF